MGANTSRASLRPPESRTDPHRPPVPPRPSDICQRCWQGPFAAHLGLVHAPALRLVDIPRARDHYDNADTYTAGGYSYSTSWQVVKSSADAGCVWCQILLSYCYYPSKKRLTVTVGTRTDAFTPQDTPRGTQNLSIAVDGGDRSMVTVFEGYVHVADENPAAPYIVARSPILDVGSTRALTLAKACLDECVHEHDRCIALSILQSSSDPLPTRVVDCSDPRHPFLASTAGQRGRYLALSYVWGEAQPHSTVLSNVSAYARGIDSSLLPRTIRDAIHVTHALGFQYLWLDTLCIIQDSVEDKQHELARMHNIYRYAHLTIIAASAKRVSEGFLQERLPSGSRTDEGDALPDISLPFICPSTPDNQTTHAPSTVTQQLGRVHITPLFGGGAGAHGYRELYNHAWEPISTRAWCMQEYLMSPRALIFTSQTLQFRCQTTTKNVGDSFYSPAPSQAHPERDRGEQRLPAALFLPEPPLLRWHGSYAWLEVYDAWLHFVQDYTRCALSFPADKLPACGAIAAEFHRVLRSDYLAGLWRDSLVNDLLWRRWGAPAPKPEPSAAAAARYRAPSWSWASVDGAVQMRQNEEGQIALAEAVQCETDPKDAALPFGEVTGGTLVLRGALIRSVLRRIPGLRHTPGRSIFPQYAKQARRWGATGDSHDDAEVKLGDKLLAETHMDRKEDEDVSRIYIILLSRQPSDDGPYNLVVGLIVARASDGVPRGQGRQVYRRVGYFEIEEETVQELGWDLTNLPQDEIELV